MPAPVPEPDQSQKPELEPVPINGSMDGEPTEQINDAAATAHTCGGGWTDVGQDHATGGLQHCTTVRSLLYLLYDTVLYLALWSSEQQKDFQESSKVVSRNGLEGRKQGQKRKRVPVPPTTLTTVTLLYIPSQYSALDIPPRVPTCTVASRHPGTAFAMWQQEGGYYKRMVLKAKEWGGPGRKSS
ncbi:hypothetical protein CIB48_g5027 [Xylaria polymorpha]|nr:hypothetical protein CIB48_g5027 [Xylaria polymorpha]